jgi:hypothetical protein
MVSLWNFTISSCEEDVRFWMAFASRKYPNCKSSAATVIAIIEFF